MPNIDNISLKLGEEIKRNLATNSQLNICAAYFSMYAFNELKKELGKIKEFNFIYNSPTFLQYEAVKKQKEFFIPPFVREKTIAGSQFEIKLRNELNQKSVARECGDWIQKKAKFKSLKQNTQTNDGIFIDSKNNQTAYVGANSFTTEGLGYTKDNNTIQKIIPVLEGKNAKQYVEQFNQIWKNSDLVEDITDKIQNYIATVYKENSPEYLYYITIYNIFNEFLDDINEEIVANEKTGFKETQIWKTMYNFQRDAVLGAINKLEKYNGCILADSVGLGKTYTALGIIKYYELKNKSALVLCPKRLAENWNTFNSNYKTNILEKDRFNYDVLFHTDLSRETGESNGKNLELLNWGNYDLLVIDESHNFRNNVSRKDRDTRYQKLMKQVLQSGVKTKVLMLSATPVNNQFNDLKNQIALAHEGQSEDFAKKLKLNKSIEKIFADAQRAFTKWSELDPENRTSKALIDSLNFDFFQILDSVTIARSRKHILKYYDTADIGEFPKRNKPINKEFELTNIENFLTFKQMFEILTKLNLKLYTPSEFIFPEKKKKYEELYDTQLGNKSELKQSTRETGIMQLMRVNLLKRLESSVESFRLTLERLDKTLQDYIDKITALEKGEKRIEIEEINPTEDELNEDYFKDELTIGKIIKINLNDMDYLSWKDNLLADHKVISNLLIELNKITPEKDKKLQELIKTIEDKIKTPINENNKKVLIFSAFADTTKYLYENTHKYLNEKHKLHVACVTGSDENKTTLKIGKNEMGRILTCFSPRSKHRNQTGLNINEEIDILFATDCISEGQNLQDCDYLINYDIHWNPVRIIQRFGRIDRIGSINKQIQLVNFWPPVALDEYIDLKARVENRMHALNLTATGEENVLVEEEGDLEYRKKQLEKLKNEVVDLEDMDNSISITDLGLNEFRVDLVNYFKEHGEIKNVPFGMHAIVAAQKEFSPGVIYVLKNLNQNININKTNRLHPFYLVYISENGEVISNHLQVKNTLDIFRALAKNKSEPNYDLCKLFNKETKEGTKMGTYSDLLHKTIESIISVKEQKDLDSIFTSGGTSIGLNEIKGLNDFELIGFLIIK